MSDTPTCGWQWYSKGTNRGDRIPNSQGFCCECSLISIEKEQIRGIECKGINTGVGSASGHCLRFSPPEEHYNGYTLSSPVLTYEIKITFSVPSQFGKAVETITLNSGTTSGRSQYGRVQLTGELATLNVAPIFENKVFFVPKYDLNPDDPSTRLLLEREDVTFDGSACNKVGTSYVAFNTQQQNACERSPGNCLANQLKDLQLGDIEKEKNAPGSGTYLLKNHGLTYKFVDNQYKMLYPVEEVQTTIVRLELLADHIRWVRTVANGKIDFIDVKPWNDGR